NGGDAEETVDGGRRVGQSLRLRKRWARLVVAQPAGDLHDLRGRRDGLRVELLEPVDVGEDPAQLARVKIHVARLERDAREHGDMADFVLRKWHDEV